MNKEKSRYLKREDGTIYDSLSSLTWIANDSFLDLEKRSAGTKLINTPRK